MQRLRRVGREHAIIEAIRMLDARHRHTMHTRGEICRKMGIKSSSRIRDILKDMEASGQLVGSLAAVDGISHEVAVYGLPVYYQTAFPQDHEIVINGVSCRMSEGWN